MTLRVILAVLFFLLKKKAEATCQASLIECPEVPVFGWDRIQDTIECHDIKGRKEISSVQRHQPILLHRGGPPRAVTCEAFQWADETTMGGARRKCRDCRGTAGN
jgi:hypothetical protein